MGNSQSINKINFESLKNIINDKTTKGPFLIISTLNTLDQECLIKNTVLPDKEIQLINNYLRENKNINIVIYGENCCDSKVISKYNQLYSLGFINLYDFK